MEEKQINKRHNDRDAIQTKGECKGEREKITDAHWKGVTAGNTKKKQAAKQPSRVSWSSSA